jgi:starch phosphorylase
MKFALNGALTIGTLDGANVEMAEEIGAENMFIFGLHDNEVIDLKAKGYHPRDYYERDPELKTVLDMITANVFSKDEPGIFEPIVTSLLEQGDTYCLLADFRSYMDTQDKVDELFRDSDKWTKQAIINVARMGKFSSDRTIIQYANDIWKIKPVHIELNIGQ